MVARLTTWILKLLLVCLLVAYEQVVSIPYLSLVVLIIIVQNQTPVGRQSLLLMSGLIIATVYQLPLGLGMALVVAAAFFWQISDRLVRQDGPRLLISCLVVAWLIGRLSDVSWSPTSSLLLIINLLLSIALVRLTAISSDKVGKRSL